MDNVLAKPADLCCLKGAFHTGEPTGSVEQIEGVDTYIAKPEAGKANGNVLLFFPDAFGLHINSFLMMDAYAERGYLTLGVDYFLGVCRMIFRLSLSLSLSLSLGVAADNMYPAMLAGTELDFWLVIFFLWVHNPIRLLHYLIPDEKAADRWYMLYLPL